MYCYPLPQEYPITSPFGNRVNPIDGTPQFHDGVDFGCPENTPVFAFASGTVVFSGKDQFGALFIDIEHNESNLKTRYVHLNELGVIRGQIVQKGQQIGLSGNTGQSTAPHLHFGTFVNNKPQDPEILLKNSQIMNPKPQIDAKEMLKAWRANVDIYLRDRGLDLSVVKPEVQKQSEDLRFDMAGQILGQMILDFMADREKRESYIKLLEKEIINLKNNV